MNDHKPDAPRRGNMGTIVLATILGLCFIALSLSMLIDKRV